MGMEVPSNGDDKIWPIKEKSPETLSKESKSVYDDPATQINTPEIRSTKPTKPLKRAISVKEDVTPKIRKSEKKPRFPERYDQIAHFPLIKKTNQVRCKNNGCKERTFVYCSKCNVHLCFNIVKDRNCFTDFHTIKENIE